MLDKKPERPRPVVLNCVDDGHLEASVHGMYFDDNKRLAVRIESEYACFSFSLEVRYMPHLKSFAEKLLEMADYVEKNNEEVQQHGKGG